MENIRIKWDLAIAKAQEATLNNAPKATLQTLWRTVGDYSQMWTKRVKARRTTVFRKVIDSLHQDNTIFQKMVSCIKKKDSRNRHCKLEVEAMVSHASHFKTTFGSAPTGLPQNIDQDVLDNTDPTIPNLQVAIPPSTDEEKKRLNAILRSMPNGKAPGSDSLPGEVWKCFAEDEELLESLLIFFNTCQALAKTPIEWKTALIVPIYKNKGNELDISNYRPIALTQVIRRIYERYISYILAPAEKYLNNTQGGFRSNRSTMDQIMIVNEFLVRIKCKATIYLDIKAAYDTVDRRILWSRLAKKFHIPLCHIKILRELFDSNITNPVIKNKHSSAIEIQRGLLQGSSLSPCLFNFFINDLLDELHKLPKQTIGMILRQNNAFFADDGALMVTNNIDAKILMNCCYEWSISNGIIFAIPKCQFVGSPDYPWKIEMNNIPLERVDRYKYLGIYLQHDGMDWATSASHRISKFKTMSQLMHQKGMNPNGWRLKQKLLVYKSFLRPMLEYGLALAPMPTPIKKALQAAQNYTLKLMVHANKCTSINALHCIMEIETIEMRNTELHSRYFNNILNGDKVTHPVGLMVRAVYQKGTKGYNSRSLTSIFLRKCTWKAQILNNTLPSMSELHLLRSDKLTSIQLSKCNNTARRLHKPRGPKNNNIIREGWKLPRHITNMIIDFKLNKIPRAQCLICSGTTGLGHLLLCGGLEDLSKDIIRKYNIELTPAPPVEISHTVDRLLWWIDNEDQPNMSIYRAVGEAILKAKLTTIPTQKEPAVEYEDDHEPEEYYTAQLIQLGILKGFQDCPSPNPKDREIPGDQANITMKEIEPVERDEDKSITTKAQCIKVKTEIDIGQDIDDPKDREIPGDQAIHRTEEIEPVKPDIVQDIDDDDIHQDNEDEVIKTIDKTNVTRRDIRRLSSYKWINDTIVDSFLYIVQQQHHPNVLCRSSYFITKLLEGGSYSFNKVRRWRHDIHAFKTIALPIKHNNNHWTMAIISVPEKTINYYDSLNGDGSTYMTAILSYLREVELRRQITTSPWTCQQHFDIPQQNNNYDCGIYMLTAIEKYINKLPMDHTTEAIKNKRQDIKTQITRYQE